MNLRNSVSRALVATGYRRNGRLHQLRLNEDFSFWVDTGPLGTRPDIAPFVGIRHDPTQQLRSRLRQNSDDPWVGTVGANVGYVLQLGYKSWEPPSETADVMSSICSATERLTDFLNVNTLPNVWMIEGTRAPGWHYNYICALVLKNDVLAVERALDAANSELCRTSNEVCDEFQDFKLRLQAAL
jgi:hypothetical protein